jgi:hypothetical protein
MDEHNAAHLVVVDGDRPGRGDLDAPRMLVERGVGLLATTGPHGAIVAHACYVPDSPESGEARAAAGNYARLCGTTRLAHSPRARSLLACSPTIPVRPHRT